jgi:hypothetical protein
MYGTSEKVEWVWRGRSRGRVKRKGMEEAKKVKVK